MKQVVLAIVVTQMFFGTMSLEAFEPTEAVLMSRAESAAVSCDETESAPHVDVIAHAPCPSDFCVHSYEFPSRDQRSLHAHAEIAVPRRGTLIADRRACTAPAAKNVAASTHPDILRHIVLRV